MSGRKAITTVSRPEFLDPDGGDRTFRAMVYDLLAVGARMQDIRDHLAAQMGVTGPQYAILMAIFHMQDEAGGAGVRAVGRRLHVSGPFVTAQEPARQARCLAMPDGGRPPPGGAGGAGDTGRERCVFRVARQGRFSGAAHGPGIPVRHHPALARRG